ncbi:MAG: glycosyltransferase [Colwellia sp.]|nr:glycosyltransferase [Colwellia sp.]
MMFSIITVCFNNPQELNDTLKSVKEQSFPDYEIIVINGGDRSAAEEVVLKYDSLVNVFISEPDKGIYDGMNKGAALAQGDFVIYLNSGDVFCNELVLSKVAEQVLSHPEAKILYGSSISDYGYKKVLCQAKNSKDFLSEKFYELGFSHQSIFVDRVVLGDSPFDLTYKVAADFNYLYPKLREYNDKLVLLGFPVSIFATGGVSDLDKTILNKEKKKIYFLNNPINIAATVHFIKLILMENIKKRLRPIIRKVKF